MKELLLIFLLGLPIYQEDVDSLIKPGQLDTVAGAVAEVAGGNRRLAALLVVIGHAETGYSLRIHEGHCRPWECDHGRARGPWQTWRNGMPAEKWAKMRGLQNTKEQASQARVIVENGLRICGTPRGAFAHYMGLPCRSQNSLVELRMRLYRRALRALE